MRSIHPILLLSGFTAPLVYVATVVVGGWATPGYSHLTQPVSALFETGAPHAANVSFAFVVYNVLLVAFGLGLMLSARGLRSLQALAAAMVLLNGAFGLLIELAPMDPIGAPVTAAGIVHMVLAGLLVLTCMAAMASLALGWWRGRAHPALAAVTVALLVLMLAGGALAALAATAGWPFLGLFQRLTIGAYLVWLPMVAWVALSEGVEPVPSASTGSP